ncbi:hypothetical protein D5086_027525 [Populus alba]|uniref:Uncharacterized protein n=1 Tax=Populus alba TaxID=43335 RepID=A0ACC4AWE7_POPAL
MIKDTQTNPGGKSRAEAAMNRSDQQHSSGQQNIPGDIIEDRTCWLVFLLSPYLDSNAFSNHGIPLSTNPVFLEQTSNAAPPPPLFECRYLSQPKLAFPAT